MAKPIEVQKLTTKAEKLAAIKVDMRSKNKNFGLEGLTMASDLQTGQRASFNIPELDKRTGGGILHGTFTIIWGGPDCGKTTDALMLVAQAQREDKVCMWIAHEPFSKERALTFGVNLDELLLVQVPKAEQSLDTIIDYARKGFVNIIVLDSVQNLAPRNLQENDKGDKSIADEMPAILARKLSQFFPIAQDPIKRNNVAVLLIGQVRSSVGIFAIEQLSGGNALKHNCRLIIKQTRTKDDAPSIKVYNDKVDKNETVFIGFSAKFRFDKVQIPNCVPEGTVLQLPYYFESGYDLPAFIKAENKEIEEATKSTILPEHDHTCAPLDSKNKITNKESKQALEIVNSPKRKRGRPKKG